MMKKLSLLLALALILGVCAFAAGCGPATPAASSEEPAPASSEEPAPVESSKEEPDPASSEEPAPVESSEEEPAPVESSEDEPEPVESSEDTEPETSDEQPTDNDNLALGKPYTISELFRMGGADAGWGWDPNAPHSYPDEGGISLTDGVKEPESDGYADPVWAGFNTLEPETGAAGYAFIRVDLGDKKDMKKFTMTVGSQKIGSGVAAPAGFEVWVSDDGETFKQVGTAEFVDTDQEPFITVTLKKSAKGRYVEFRVLPKGNWMFVSEVEVF